MFEQLASDFVLVYHQLSGVGRFLNEVWPFIAVPVLFWLVLRLWLHYVRRRFIAGMDFVLLEIEVPRDVKKTPLAMELVLSNACYQASLKGLWEIWILGSVRFWYSLEIAVFDGNVHFYIRTPSRTRTLVESQIYAQYPQARVVDAEDFTFRVPYKITPECGWNMWGCEFIKAKHDAYPLKTYVDFGLDKPSDKEEEKVDPITPTLEYMGSLKPEEQLWLQILIRATQKTYKTPGTWFKTHGWNEEVEHFFAEMVKPFTRIAEGALGTPPQKDIRVPTFYAEDVESIKRSVDKLGFDCGIRILYIAPNTVFSKNGYRNARTMFRQYSSPSMNRLERVHSTQIDSPWQDPTGNVVYYIKNRFLEHFRERSLYYPPLEQSFHYPWPFSFFLQDPAPHYYVMNTEELATIYHFPGRVSETPALHRVESKRAEPPSNLPVSS